MHKSIIKKAVSYYTDRLKSISGDGETISPKLSIISESIDSHIIQLNRFMDNLPDDIAENNHVSDEVKKTICYALDVYSKGLHETLKNMSEKLDVRIELSSVNEEIQKTDELREKICERVIGFFA